MQKFLIVKIGAIGDVIMALPIINAIKEEYGKDTHITWVAGKSVEPILKKFSIDELIIIDDSKLLQGSFFDRIFTIIKCWEKISFRKFDLIAMGHASKLYRLITLFSSANKYNSFSHSLGKMWPVPNRHHTDEYVRLVKQKPFTNRIESSYLHIEQSKEISNIIGDTSYIVLAPGGAKNSLANDYNRRWPIENYVELTNLFLKNNKNIVIVGANSDKWIEEYFKDLPIINLVGKTSLLDLVSVMENSDYVITHDSGPLHLAGLAHAHLLGLFGPTNPMEKIPYTGKSKYIWDNESYSCVASYDGKYYYDSKYNIGLNNIKPLRVFNIVMEDLAKKVVK